MQIVRKLSPSEKEKFLQMATGVLRQGSRKVRESRELILDAGGVVRHLGKDNGVMFCQFKVNGKNYIDFNNDVEKVQLNKLLVKIDESKIDEIGTIVEVK